MLGPTPSIRLSLRTKWTAALLVTVMLPMALFAFATARILKRGLEDAEHQLEVAVIDHVAEAVARTMRDASEVTHRVGQLLTDDKIGEDARMTMSQDALARSTGLAQVAVYASDGKLLDAIGRKDDAAPPPPPEKLPDEVMKAAAEGAWLQPVYAGAPGAERGVLRYVEAVTREGQTRAFVLGSVTRGIAHRTLLCIGPHGVSPVSLFPIARRQRPERRRSLPVSASILRDAFWKARLAGPSGL